MNRQWLIRALIGCGICLSFGVGLVGCTDVESDAHEGHDDQDDHDDHAGHDDHEEHGEVEQDHEGHDHGEDGQDGESEGGHDEHGENEVHLTPEAVRSSGIRMVPVQFGSLSGDIEVPAEVRLNPDRVVHVSPMLEGQLVSVDVTTGDRVVADQPLAVMRSIELGRARAEYARASSLRSIAGQHLERQEQLREEGISSEHSLLSARLDYEQADAERDSARSLLRVLGAERGSGPDLTLVSPMDGVVIERHATRGETVSSDDTIFVIADLSRVWVIGHVFEQQVGAITEGMTAIVTLSAYGSRTWSGTVDYVGATLDEATRSLPVRIEIENPDGVLRPGLLGNVRLMPPGEVAQSILIPEAAVQELNGNNVVFIAGDEPNAYLAQPVSLGRASGGLVEVVDGLNAVTEVVVDGAFVLKSELVRGQLGHGHAH